jgi:hypothetical protein
MPDRIEILREAAQARHAATLRRAEDTLRTLVRRGARSPSAGSPKQPASPAPGSTASHSFARNSSGSANNDPHEARP